MSYSLSLLEKWAYIMVILVCFTILITFFAYILCFLLILQRKLRSSSRSLHDDDTEAFKLFCCDDTSQEETNKTHLTSSHHLYEPSQQHSRNESDSSQVKLNSILLKPLSERVALQENLNTTSVKVNESLVKTESIDSFMPKLIRNLKSMFTFDTNDTSNETNLTNLKTVVIPAEINSSSSDETPNEPAQRVNTISETSQPQRKSNFRRTSTLTGRKLPRAFRNSSLPNAKAHVKFNVKKEDDSDESESSVSDDYPSSIGTNRKKHSVSSSQDSRKNSTSSSSYYQSSVVDLYRQQRLSNPSLFSGSSSSRRLSIAHSSPFSHESGVRLVTLEQQDKLYDEKGKQNKKLSLHSIFGAQISKLDMLNMRRYSMATNDVSEKFWVPAEIAAQKQRSSLPNTSTVSSSALINTPEQARLNSLGLRKTTDYLKILNEKNSQMDSAYTSQLSSIDQAVSSSSNSTTNNNMIASSSPPPPPLPTCSTKLTGRRRASMFDPIDPTELQKTLYSNVNNSNNYASKHNSTSSDHSSGENSIGTVEFAVQYMSDCQRLIVDILRIFDMTVATRQDTEPSTVDILCKCILMPDKLSFSTKPIKMCSNPIFEEQFDFRFLEASHLESCFLEISLVELDKQSREEYCIGSSIIRLNYSNIEMRKIFLKDFKIYSKTNEDNYIGELMFSLAYLTAAERLTIIIMKARNLIGIGNDKKTLPDPCVKVSLIGKDGKKLKKKKTSTQKATLNPIYNEEIVFTNLKREQLDEIFINFNVYHDSLTSREPLGTFMISSISKGNDYIQWKNMIDGKKSIAWWHNLLAPNTLDKVLTSNNNRMNSYRLAKSINFSSLKIKS